MTTDTLDVQIPESLLEVSWWHDRRESPRLPVTLRVQSSPYSPPESTVGDLSLGGVGWTGEKREVGERVQVSLNLGGDSEGLRVDAEIFRTTRNGDETWHQARFIEISLDAELVIARWLHEQQQLAQRAA